MSAIRPQTGSSLHDGSPLLRLLCALVLALAVAGSGVPSSRAAGPETGQPFPARLVLGISDPSSPHKPEISRRLSIGGVTIEVSPALTQGIPGGEVTAYVTGAAGTDTRAAGAALRAGTASVTRLAPRDDGRTALGLHHVTVVPVYWTAKPTSDAEIVSAVTGSMTKVAAYFDTATQSQIRFTTDRVFGWNKISLTAAEIESCDYEAMERKARAVAPSTPKDERHHFVVMLEPTPTCAWGGRGTVGPGELGDLVTWLNYQPYEGPTYAHEFGHNLGLWHTGYLQCWNDTRTANVTLSANCDQRTYNDPWDLMSAPLNWPGMLATINRQRIGVLPVTDNPLIMDSQRVTLKPVAAGSGVRGFQLQAGNVQYFVEYRTPVGLDDWIDDSTYVDPKGVTRTDPGGGVTVRRQDDFFGQFGEIDLLDFHPDANPLSYQWHPGLEAGESYTIADHGITLSVVSTSSTAAVVDVTITQDDGVVRWDGRDRYAASAAISARTFPANTWLAYVASGEVFSDALSGAPVAGRDGAPLLLTRRDSLPATIAAELQRLKPSTIVVLGGPATVSESVVDELRAYASETVERRSGADRYAASAAISRAAFLSTVDAAFVASGEIFSDALSGAPVAARAPGPMLLTRPDGIPAPIAAELRRLKPKRIVIVGGPASVSEQVRAQLAEYTAGTVSRWFGSDRYAASAAISQHGYPRPPVETAYVASGSIFTDALSGAPVAGMTAGPLLLVRTDSIPDPIAAELSRLRPTKIVVLGGPASVSPGVEADLATFVRP